MCHEIVNSNLRYGNKKIKIITKRFNLFICRQCKIKKKKIAAHMSTTFYIMHIKMRDNVTFTDGCYQFHIEDTKAIIHMF